MKDPKIFDKVDWSKWVVFFCDERFVDLTHPDSNYKAINDGLLSEFKKPDVKNKIEENNVLKLDFEAGNVSAAATAYENDLRSVFKNDSLPKFDLLILGMGPDGHTCSLSPNHELLKERSKWIASLEDSPKPPPERITFTMNVVNNATDIVFITMGKGKAENIRKAIEEEPSESIPVSLIKPVNGTVHWFMDFEAASLLKVAS